MGLVKFQTFGALRERRGALAGIGMGGQDQASGPFGRDHGEAGGTQRARGFAEEMIFVLPGFLLHDLHRGFQIFHAGSDVGIAVGAIGRAIPFMVHRPNVEAGVGETIHHGIIVMTGHVQIEPGQGRARRAVHQEQNRHLPLARPLPVHREMDLFAVTGFNRLVLFDRSGRGGCRGGGGRDQRGGGRQCGPARQMGRVRHRWNLLISIYCYRMPTMAFHSLANAAWVFRNASQSSGISCLNAVIGRPPGGGATSVRAE